MVAGLLPSAFSKSAFETLLPLQYIGEPISQGSTAGGAGGGEAAAAGGRRSGDNDNRGAVFA